MWTELFIIYSNIQVALHITLNFSWTAGIFIYEKTGQACEVICENPNFQYFAGYVLWTYCKTVLYIEDCAKQAYDNSTAIKTVVDCAQWTIEQYEILFSRSRKEPEAEYWMSLCSLSRVPLSTSFDLFEIYEILQKSMTTELQQSFANAFSCSDQSMIKKNDLIFLMKSKEHYKVIRYNMVFPENDLEPIVSECRFLSVTYSHPKMRGPVELNIPVGMMIVGNELLSRSFIRRCLAYQNQSFVYDMDYKVEVIDQDIKCFTLTSSDYVKVGLCNVEVKQT